MADITVTEADIQQGASARIKTIAIAEVVTIGALIGINRSDSNRAYLCDSDAAATPYRQVILGISLSKGLGANQTITYQDDDVITFGAGILEAGMTYTTSPTQGKICPITDMAIFTVKTVQITSNVATFTTNIAHPFQAGQVLTTANCGSIYNGSTQTVVASLSATTFSVAITHANDGPNTVTGTVQLKGIVVSHFGVAQDTSVMKLAINNTGITR